jgi:hypothetical protein
MPQTWNGEFTGWSGDGTSGVESGLSHVGAAGRALHDGGESVPIWV